MRVHFCPLPPDALAEIDVFIAEVAWRSIAQTQDAWGPRPTYRIERLILAAQKARADLVELRADVPEVADRRLLIASTRSSQVEW